MTASRPHVAVVGASAFGGWSALHLLRRGARVTLVDAWGPGNSRASSGGDTRVIRAIYGTDRIYVEMVKRSFTLWEALQRTTGERLYTETGVLWLHRGDDAYVRSSAPLLAELGFPLDHLALDEARRRYPQVSFDGVKSAWVERRAGALYARRACAVVRDAFVAEGGTFRGGLAKPGSIENARMSPLTFEDGSVLEADAYVFACGPWLGTMFPDVVGARIRPTRQEVHYFGSPAGSDAFGARRMPVWIDFGERIYYGIPDLDGRGFKVADDTRGPSIDPTSAERIPSGDAIERSRKLLAERFPRLANAPFLSAEICQYENSPDGHLIVDRHPSAANALIAGGGSGHGFKLSPAVGELVSRMVLGDEQPPSLFRLARLDQLDAPKTQFERTG